jgi:hypothetical protein
MNTWTRIVVASQGAHDIRVADIDRDGKLDIICSGSAALGVGRNFIASQNSPTNCFPTVRTALRSAGWDARMLAWNWS